jgi:ATP-dependent DNA helicase RecQ
MKATQTKKIQRTLKEVFGHEELRPLQRDVIEAVIGGEDVLAIMPTGGGKSLCYQLPGLLADGMTLVVSPLISLMKDQSDKLEDMGVEAANLNSAVPAAEQQEAIESVEDEASDFVFMTPERFTNEEFLGSVSDANINLVVIDEAHCISQWGHDFRPAFLELRDAIRRVGDPPVLALTATATEVVINDIREQLRRPRMRVLQGGIYRPNLHFRVVHTTSDSEKRARLAEILGETDGSAMVYCATVKAVDEVADFLNDHGIEAGRYHGKLSPKARNETQDRFMNGQVKNMVATNAFGMGVDKPDIRAVIHWQMPGALEAYYQEAGRAGRDGETAACVLLYDTRDRRIQQFFLGGRYPTGEDVSEIYETLKTLCNGGEAATTREQLVATIGDRVTRTKVRVALSLLKEAKILRERRGGTFELAKAGLAPDSIRELADSYLQRGTDDREKLEKMMLYAQSAVCRWQTLNEYFGTESESEKCGTCDNCVEPAAKRLEVSAPTEKMTKAEETELLETLRTGNGITQFEIGDTVTVPKFGTGVIKIVYDDTVEIKLANGDVKTFKSSYVKKG